MRVEARAVEGFVSEDVAEEAADAEGNTTVVWTLTEPALIEVTVTEDIGTPAALATEDWIDELKLARLEGVDEMEL